MSETEQNVKNRLLSSAKEEFLEKGYTGASLRQICAKAGVTTGALYFFFQNKEDLFSALVEEPLREFKKLYQECAEQELRDLSSFEETEDRVITFLFHNREACILLLEKSAGTKYASFRADYHRQLEETFGEFFRKYGGDDIDPALIHLIASMRMHGYLELLYGDYQEGRTKQLAKDMGVYADAGFAALIQRTNFIR